MGIGALGQATVMHMAEELGRRKTDHFEPCGLLQVANANIVNIQDDIVKLHERVDRLPNWMVMLWGVTTAALGSALTVVFFLANRLL